MDERLAADLAALPDLLESTRRLAVDTLDGIDRRPVVGRRPDAPAAALPPEGIGLAAALEEFATR